jgi:regulator of sigma E protease
MEFFFLLLLFILLNVIYTIGFLGAHVLRKSPQHFFLGFDPAFFTFSCRNVKFTLGIYIPIIGLSRIYSCDTAGKKQLFYPWQLQRTSVIQRLFLTYSGVATLFVFGVLAAIFSVYSSSEQYIAKGEVMKYGVYPSAQARTVGFLPGDKVIAVNGKDYNDFTELIRPEIIYSLQTNYTILRNGQKLILPLTNASSQNSPPQELFLSINAPFAVKIVLPGSPAENAGILPNDRIVKVNGYPVTSFQEMNAYFESDEDGEVMLGIQRGDSSDATFEKSLVLNEYTKIGVSIEQKIDYHTKEYSLAESCRLGARRFWSSLVVQFKILGRMLGVEDEKKLSGPIGISAAFGNTFSFSRFISFTSLYITFIIMLNFLPLPKSAMLEVLPLSYEAVRRRALSYKSFRRIRQISIALLLLIMVVQVVSDIVMLF